MIIWKNKNQQILRLTFIKQIILKTNCKNFVSVDAKNPNAYNLVTLEA